MANYNNAAYIYAQVLAGTGYYMKDDLLRYSEGVKTMQTKLNAAGYNCGTPDGKFGTGTNIAVRSFQSAKGLQITLKRNVRSAEAERSFHSYRYEVPLFLNVSPLPSC